MISFYSAEGRLNKKAKVAEASSHENKPLLCYKVSTHLKNQPCRRKLWWVSKVSVAIEQWAHQGILKASKIIV